MHNQISDRKLGNKNCALHIQNICISKQIGNHKPAMVEAFHAKNFVGNRAALVGVGIDHARLVKYADILKLNKGAGN